MFEKPTPSDPDTSSDRSPDRPAPTAAEVERAARAYASRRVDFIPLPDGMCLMHAVLPAEGARVVEAALHQVAGIAPRADDQQRSPHAAMRSLWAAELSLRAAEMWAAEQGYGLWGASEDDMYDEDEDEDYDLWAWDGEIFPVPAAYVRRRGRLRRSP